MDCSAGGHNQRIVYWGNIIRASALSGLFMGPLVMGWYGFLHRLTLCKVLVNRSANLKVALMTVIDMLPFVGQRIALLLNYSPVFRILEEDGVITSPDKVKQKIQRGVPLSANNGEHVSGLKTSEILNLRKLRE